MDNKLSIIIPCFNEESTILQLLNKIDEVDLGPVQKEIIIIDDGSTDNTSNLLRQLDNHLVLFNHRNQGKGFSIRQGLKQSTGNIIIVQDADLEYNPQNYEQLLQPILQGKAKVVYGSRERNPANKEHSSLTFYWGGLLMTKATNFLYGSNLTDQPTCYKVFDRQVLENIELQCQGFEFCSEVTAKVLRQNIEIFEVPIDYFPRKKAEGKKIKWQDGIIGIWTLIKHKFK